MSTDTNQAMSKKYTPTTDEVRAWCSDATDMGDRLFDQWWNQVRAELVREGYKAANEPLSAHDAKVRAKAFDEARAAINGLLPAWADSERGTLIRKLDALKAVLEVSISDD
jgi:hypothetical protein